MTLSAEQMAEAVGTAKAIVSTPEMFHPHNVALARALIQSRGEVERLAKELEIHHAKSTCMCGSYVSQHTTGDGHSPVSMYDYALDQAEARVTELESEASRLRAALEDLERALRVHYFSPRGHETPADRDSCAECGNDIRANDHVRVAEGHPSDVKREALIKARATLTQTEDKT